MLHHRPFVAEPAGTRPWMSGSGLDPGSQLVARGVAANGGPPGFRIGAASGVSPPPRPSARRSLGCGKVADARTLPADAGTAETSKTRRAAARTCGTLTTRLTSGRLPARP